MLDLQLREEYRDIPVSRIDDVYSGKTEIYERYYQVGDHESVPSVTTVLEMIAKPRLRDWKMNMALNYLKGKYEARQWDARIAIPPWERYPSSKRAQSFRRRVTTTWRDALASRRRNATAHPHRVRAEAGDIGTQIHEAISAEMQGEHWEPVTPAAAVAMESYRLWREDSAIVPLWTEQTVWSLEHGYAGSVDLVGMEGEQLVVLDWKTGSGVHNEAALQVAAYANAIEELTGQAADTCSVIHLDKDSPGWREYRVYDWRSSFDVFLGALNTWKLWHDGVFATHDC